MLSKSISILELMVKDHRKIEELIDKLEEESKDDFESMEKAFNKFEWELEKHIFTEEKAIFTSYTPDDVIEGYKMLPELTKQHNYIVNRLNNWREDIRKKRMITDIYSFKVFLDRHKNFEEEKVYPNLDQSLSEKEKKHIVAKINEIVQK
jgi:hemerythrin-like domain-containing protein